MVDDKDLGCRPEHAGLLGLADKMDAKRVEIAALTAPARNEADALAKAGKPRLAAEIYEAIADRYRREGIRFAADEYDRLARKCRKPSSARGRR